MIDFSAIFACLGMLAALIGGGTIFLTPVFMAIHCDWRCLFLYIPMAIVFWIGAVALDKNRNNDEEAE